MLFVDKYRPKKLDKMDYHPELSARLVTLAESEEFPHLMVYGPSGAGKKTRIMGLLRELFGNGVNKLRMEHKTFQPQGASSSSKIELTTIASNYHIELTPADAGIRDRLVVQEVIKEIASYRLVDTKAKKQFKVVVLMEVDRLSKQAQHALRRTMEKHTSSCRLILCCNSSSKVIDPIRSRCVGIRVGAPTTDEICQVLSKVCAKEAIRENPVLFSRIAKDSDRNLRRAILMLEACCVKQQPLTDDQLIPKAEWDEYTFSLANLMLQEQSPAGLLKARDKVYDLLANCIPADVLMQTLLRHLLSRVDDDLKPQVIEWAAYYEHRIHRGSKDIFHIEAFIAKFMMIYKRFLIEMYS